MVLEIRREIVRFPMVPGFPWCQRPRGDSGISNGVRDHEENMRRNGPNGSVGAHFNALLFIFVCT